MESDEWVSIRVRKSTKEFLRNEVLTEFLDNNPDMEGDYVSINHLILICAKYYIGGT